ncbi:hypothetical protein GCM10011617_19820 [Novosphingobium arvoryzae]|uniref:Uncharacterized protein n=1 Tax=Novosphingobium arvoryzae TaxID=1256514 RepID=A0A918RIJ2_9SPHN|nr:hypothetical protein GCM10011617_19820 [Novosphingobium arvoryzae]
MLVPARHRRTSPRNFSHVSRASAVPPGVLKVAVDRPSAMLQRQSPWVIGTSRQFTAGAGGGSGAGRAAGGGGGGGATGAGGGAAHDPSSAMAAKASARGRGRWAGTIAFIAYLWNEPPGITSPQPRLRTPDPIDQA